MRALSRNNEKAGIAATMTCIEPYPWPALRRINGPCETRIITQGVQEVGVEVFERCPKGIFCSLTRATW